MFENQTITSSTSIINFILNPDLELLVSDHLLPDVNSIYYADRGLDKNQILEPSTCQYMRNNFSLVLNGFTGSGKIFLACALGKAACRQLYRIGYIRVPGLLELRAEATLQGKGISRLVSNFSNYNLLILDEWLNILVRRSRSSVVA
jgi:DNA replication protein DnaC